jgi:hypothetical protein
MVAAQSGRQALVRYWISLCLIVLFLTEGKAQIISGSGPNQYLKGITAITYTDYFEDQMTGPRCAIQRENWKIAVDFVANQSTTLKLINEKEYRTRHDELLRVKDKLLKTSSATRLDPGKFNAAQKEFLDYANIPRLIISVRPIELQNGCVGTLEGKLEADVAPTHILATGAEVEHPTVVIWSYDYALKGPHQSFSGFMIRSGEQLIKTFVNAWTEAQKLF